MPDYVLPISFKPHEELKLNNFMKISEFKTKSSLIKEALFSYIDNPEYRNPVKKKTSSDESYELYVETKERELKKYNELTEKVVSITEENSILNNKMDLVLKKLKIDQRKIKIAEKKDTSMEDLFNDRI